MKSVFWEVDCHQVHDLPKDLLFELRSNTAHLFRFVGLSCFSFDFPVWFHEFLLSFCNCVNRNSFHNVVSFSLVNFFSIYVLKSNCFCTVCAVLVVHTVTYSAHSGEEGYDLVTMLNVLFVTFILFRYFLLWFAHLFHVQVITAGPFAVFRFYFL